jgi:ClpP class serine protease
MNHLISRFLHEPFFMTDDYAQVTLLPAISSVLKGEPLKNDSPSQQTVYAYNDRSIFKKRTNNLEKAPAGAVAVYQVTGVMMKYDSLFSTGMMSLEAAMLEADQLENISAHVIVIDSGGGEAAFMHSFANTIKNDIKKPVIAFINGRCASAAYYLASACDKIYANEKTDQVGSIGVLVTAVDFKPFYKKQGIELHEIYATQSTKKNELFNEAYKGNYKPLQQELLNPFAVQFIETVQKFRPGLREEDAFKGKIYTAGEAEKIGMIDGIKNFKTCIKEASRMSEEPRFKSAVRQSIRRAAQPSFSATASTGATAARPTYQVKADPADKAAMRAMRTEITELKSRLVKLEARNHVMKTKILEYQESVVKIQTEWSRMKNAPGDAVTRAFTPGDAGLLKIEIDEPRKGGLV